MSEQLVSRLLVLRVALALSLLLLLLVSIGLLAFFWFGISLSTLAIAGMTLLSLLAVTAGTFSAFGWWRFGKAPSAQMEMTRRLQQVLQRHLRENANRERTLAGGVLAQRVLFISPARTEGSGPCAMTELGYVPIETVITIDGVSLSIWSAPATLAFRLETSPGATLSLEMMGEWLEIVRRSRPERPLNAIHIELDLAQLADDPEGAAQRRLANQIANRTLEGLGLDLPVHIALAGLENSRDLVRAAILTESISEKAQLGGFLDSAVGDLPAQIHALFENMAIRLETVRFDAMKRQLMPDFCSSLLAAPIQLRLLCAQLIPAIQDITTALPPRSDALNLQSIFFIGTAATLRVVDPMVQVVSLRFLGMSPRLASSGLEAENPVTHRHAGAIADALHGEAFRHPPYAVAVWRRRVRNGLLTVLLGALIGWFAWTAYVDHRHFMAINEEMSERFARYFAALSVLDPGADGLVQRVMLLGDLREGLAAYDPPYPRVRWLGRSRSQEEVYRDAYHTELVGGYQRALREYIERDLFAYNALADGVSLFSLALIEVQFHTDQARNALALQHYFLDSMAQEGEIEANFLAIFRGTLEDLFALNQPISRRNTELNTVVARNLSGLDTAEMLYQALLRDPYLGQRIDLRTLVGPRFGEVFAADLKPEQYLISRAFTQEGFERIFAHDDLQAIADMIASYQVLIGERNTAEINSLLRRVGELYADDYIAAWTTFYQGLRMRPVTSWSETRLLVAALANPVDNPINKLVQALHTHTVLTEGGNAEGTRAREESGSVQVLSRRARTQQRITDTLSPYFMQSASADGRRSEFELLLDQVRTVNQWLESARSDPQGAGHFLLAAYGLDGQATPIAALHKFSTATEVDAVRQYGLALSMALDEVANQRVREYLNLLWQQEVVVPYQDVLRNTFPFDPSRSSDLPLRIFTELFAPTAGVLRQFRDTHLAHFERGSGGFRAAPGFLPGSRIGLVPEAERMFQVAAEIGQTMFQNDRPQLNFELRTSRLAPELSRLTLFAERELYHYSHGPVLWSAQRWPLNTVPETALRLRLQGRSQLIFEQEERGIWSWFRLLRAGVPAKNPSLDGSEIRFGIQDATATLQFSVDGELNPLDADFFTRFRLPERLF